MHDQIMAQCLSSSRALHPLSGKPLQLPPPTHPRPQAGHSATPVPPVLSLSVPAPDMTPNIRRLLAAVPAGRRDVEHEQVRLRSRRLAPV